MIKIIIKNKKILFSFVLGLLFSGVGVYAATTYMASDISYKDTTVEAALNDLYSKSNDCIHGKITITNDCTTTSGCLIEEKIQPTKFILYSSFMSHVLDLSVNSNNFYSSNFSAKTTNNLSVSTYYTINSNGIYGKNFGTSVVGQEFFYIACK